MRVRVRVRVRVRLWRGDTVVQVCLLGGVVTAATHGEGKATLVAVIMVRVENAPHMLNTSGELLVELRFIVSGSVLVCARMCEVGRGHPNTVVERYGHSRLAPLQRTLLS